MTGGFRRALLYLTRSLGALRAPTCSSRPFGPLDLSFAPFAKGHTHRTLTIYDALAIDDAAEILLQTNGRTNKAILGVGFDEIN